MSRQYKYVFGPVSSRRLGKSLGIDVVPHKTCSYDCIYCQIGRTTDKTVKRAEYAPLDAVVSEVRARLAVPSAPDYLTISGSGEPTLYSRLGELIRELKRLGSIPVAVITNGSLLWDKAVQDELLQADLVVPSLDAADEKTFRLINRPHEGVSFARMADGLVSFRKRYAGKYWLEVFLVEGINTGDSNIARFAALIERIGPDKVHLNTVDRPPAEEFARPSGAGTLARFTAGLGPNVEIVTRPSGASSSRGAAGETSAILAMLRRRPCTAEDVSKALDLHTVEAVKILEAMAGRNEVQRVRIDARVFYRAADDEPDKVE